MSQKTLEWRANRFYWAVIDTPILPRQHQRSEDHRGYLLEPYLPVPVDQVHTAYARLADGRMVACSVERSVLRSEVRLDAQCLVPDSIPAEVPGGEAVDPHALNLLTGTYEPAAALRVRRWTVLAALIAATAL